MQKIYDYWALNDVTASYFILATIAHIEGRYDDARGNFALILRDFRLAQMWDEGGWFWNPVDTIKQQYIIEDPVHYGSLAPLVPGASDMAAAGSSLQLSQVSSSAVRALH